MDEEVNSEETQGIRVIDERKKPFFLVDKYIVWNWLPFIGVEGYVLYSIYLSLVNHEKGCAFPSLNQIARFLKRGKSTIVKYNKVLEDCGLIRIERKLNNYGAYVANNYYILDVPDVPKNRIPELTERSFIKEKKTGCSDQNKASGGGHVQDKGVTDKTRGGHPQDKDGHVQDSNNKNKKKNKEEKLSLSESALNIPEQSIFSLIPKPILARMAEKYSSVHVKSAIDSLDHAYRKDKKGVRSPLALLKTALEEGFEPVPVEKKEVEKELIQNELPGTERDNKWDEIVHKYHLLPEPVRKSWESLQEELCQKMGMHVFEAWFGQLVPTHTEGECLTVYTQTQTIQDYIDKKWNGQIKNILQAGTYSFKAIKFVV